MPWPPKVFWLGVLVMYGYTFLMWALEATAGINHVWVGPVLAPTIYASLIGTFIIPVVVAFLYFYIPEKAEEARGGS